MASAAVGSDVSLEIWLSKATNVLNEDEDWEAIVGFCDKVNKDIEGPLNALKLLVHKIQSPQERESLLALTTLEACAKNCGRRFQAEIGKFRFLNEIIKLISPKFMGNQTSPKVKKKCIELLFCWSEVLEYEPKIKEAYQMLRRQGIIKEDPVVYDNTLEASMEAPPPPPRSSIFDNDEKSKLLSRLLRSKNPDDLMAANRLIKNMVKQDEERTEKVSQRIHQLDIVYDNVKLLNDMLQNYQSTDRATESDKEIMKELYDNLEKQRPKLFRLASDTDESDESGITEILKANDEVIKVMALYEDVMSRVGLTLLTDTAKRSATSDYHQPPSTDLLTDPEPPPPSYASALLDDQLLKLGLDDVLNGTEQPPAATSQSQLDDFDLLVSSDVSSHSVNSFDLLASVPSSTSAANSNLFSMSQSATQIPFSSTQSFSGIPLSVGPPLVRPMPSVQPAFQPAVQPAFHQPQALSPSFPLAPNSLLSQPLQPVAAGTVPIQPSPAAVLSSTKTATNGITSDAKKLSSGLESLDVLGQSVLQKSLSTVPTTVEWPSRQPAAPVPKVPMNQMTKTVLPTTPQQQQSDPLKVFKSTESATLEIMPLTDVFVPLESIQPGGLAPIVAYDKNDLKIMFHFGKDHPRPDVQVIAVSVMSTNTSPVKGFVFQAAVPKVMKVKLQPASASDLPAFNPILPPSAITQVMLVAHRPQDKVLLKFKITYSLKDAIVTDVGEVQFVDTY